ncbi:MAG: hypothetical protein K0U45_06550 [Alphaproteobacteria bacterium]|nr:hypothetical protein [Alphaproteobacteria bacterium]
MKLRIQPWLTTDCVRFLQHFFKWYPKTQKHQLRVLEFGAGNSTLFFLQKNCAVTSFESRATYIAHINAWVDGFEKNLNITQATKFHHIDDKIFNQNWDVILIDGIARRQILQRIVSVKSDALIIIDNIEHAADWGNIAPQRPQRADFYRQFLQNSDYQHYLFEQIEGRDGHSTADDAGFETPHRWISAVAWRKTSIFGQLMLTQLGLPLVTLQICDQKALLGQTFSRQDLSRDYS